VGSKHTHHGKVKDIGAREHCLSSARDLEWSSLKAIGHLITKYLDVDVALDTLLYLEILWVYAGATVLYTKTL
jgi:hypothetical protein